MIDILLEEEDESSGSGMAREADDSVNDPVYAPRREEAAERRLTQNGRT